MNRRLAWLLLGLLVVLCAVAVVTPALLIAPFRAQSPGEVQLSWWLRRIAPTGTVLVALSAITLAVVLWRGARWFGHLVVVLALGGIAAAAWFARQNHFEWMFAPLPRPSFATTDAGFVGPDDMVLAVTLGEDSAAYPVRLLAYHHVVEDVVGGVPLVVTYCTLCHTGLVWETTLDGKRLRFHLIGINNQNFVMRDDETGSWWQQVTGEAIAGPMRGRRLRPVAYDELTLSTWRSERPGGRVLEPDPVFVSEYDPPDWEKYIARLPTVTPIDPADRLAPRDAVLGVSLEGSARAYPLAELLAAGGASDELGGQPLVLVVAKDRRSIRAFSRRIDGAPRPLAPRGGELVDAETGQAWDFSGAPPEGSTSPRLERIPVLIDFWFDWKNYHPATSVQPAPEVR